MKLQKIVAAVAAASLLLGSGGAFAQPDGRDARGSPRFEARDGHRDSRPQQRGEARDDRRRDARHDTRRDYRVDERRHGADDRRYGAGDYRGRGAGPDRSFHRGGRLPSHFRERQHVVSDWRGHRLSAPPRGHQWVQAGGDYVLVALATGIIASILLNP